MRTLIINSSNLILDGQNNKLVYRFPNSVKFDNHYIALGSLQMYYSWFNISNLLNNNTFSYNWRDGVGIPATFTINVPNGIYEISTLNQLLQFNFILNGHYLRNSVGDNVYYAEFVVNPSRYAVQINTYLFPIALPAGFSNPASVPFPPQSFNPIITLPPKINEIFGYISGFATNQNLNNAFIPPVSNFISKNSLGTLSHISTSAPNVQPNSSVLLNISNIDNDYAQPTGIIYTIVPSVAVGEIINEKPSEFIWNKLLNGTYNELRLNILGQNLSPLVINDPSMVFVMVIKDGSENF